MNFFQVASLFPGLCLCHPLPQISVPLLLHTLPGLVVGLHWASWQIRPAGWWSACPWLSGLSTPGVLIHPLGCLLPYAPSPLLNLSSPSGFLSSPTGGAGYLDPPRLCSPLPTAPPLCSLLTPLPGASFSRTPSLASASHQASPQSSPGQPSLPTTQEVPTGFLHSLVSSSDSISAALGSLSMPRWSFNTSTKSTVGRIEPERPGKSVHVCWSARESHGAHGKVRFLLKGG